MQFLCTGCGDLHWRHQGLWQQHPMAGTFGFARKDSSPLRRGLGTQCKAMQSRGGLGSAQRDVSERPEDPGAQVELTQSPPFEAFDSTFCASTAS